MADEYRVFYLNPGQGAPIKGTTHFEIGDEGYAWSGEVGLWNKMDPVSNKLITSHIMDSKEYDQFEDIIDFEKKDFYIKLMPYSDWTSTTDLQSLITKLSGLITIISQRSTDLGTSG